MNIHEAAVVANRCISLL